MPFAWAALTIFLGSVVVPLARQVAVGIGFGVVTYVGMTFALDQLQDLFFSQMTGLPINMRELVGMMRVDDAVNIMFSAYAAKAAASGWANNRRRKTMLQPWNKPGATNVTWNA